MEEMEKNKNRALARIVPYAVLTAVLVLTAACPKAPVRGSYDFDPPPRDWTPLKGEDGTLLFRHDSREMGITVYTLCGRYLDAPLEPLARNLFIGFKDKKVVERGETEVSGKQAFFIVMECTLEGAPLIVKAYTFKAENCIYDVVYFASPSRYESGIETFETFVRGFEAG